MRVLHPRVAERIASFGFPSVTDRISVVMRFFTVRPKRWDARYGLPVIPPLSQQPRRDFCGLYVTDGSGNVDPSSGSDTRKKGRTGITAEEEGRAPFDTLAA